MKKEKSFIESKGFAIACLIFGLLGILIMLHHMGSYSKILNPADKPWIMQYLMENQILTNDRSGSTFLRMFTNLSNIFVDLYLILFAIGIFGQKEVYHFTHNESLRGSITLNILITGIIYCCVLLPFGGGKFPTEIPDAAGVMQSTGAMWFTNIVNFWNHIITPIVFTAFWFKPVEYKTLNKVRYSLVNLIFPICYFIVSIVLGNDDGFYPYPFLSTTQFYGMLFKNKPYDSTVGVLLIVAVVIVLSAIFFGVSIALEAIHNKIVAGKESK